MALGLNYGLNNLSSYYQDCELNTGKNMANKIKPPRLNLIQ